MRHKQKRRKLIKVRAPARTCFGHHQSVVVVVLVVVGVVIASALFFRVRLW